MASCSPPHWPAPLAAAIRILRGAPAPGPPPDWRTLSDAARDERMLPLVAEACLRSDPASAVPDSIRSIWESEMGSTAAWNTALLARARAFVERLDAAGAPSLVLKGAVLAETVYAHIGLRPMHDVDILIRPASVPAAHRALVGAGYQARLPGGGATVPEPSPFLNAVVYSHPREPKFFFHVHWHWINASYPLGHYLDRIDLERLFAESVSFPLAGGTARRMGDRHFLLHLAEHSLKHVYEPFLMVCDLDRVLRADPWRGPASPVWGAFCEEAGRFGLRRAAGYALHFAREFLGTPVPDEPLRELLGEARGFWDRQFVKLVCGNVRRGGVNGLVYLFEQPRWRDRWKFLAGAFAPGEAVRTHLAEAPAGERKVRRPWERAGRMLERAGRLTRNFCRLLRSAPTDV